VKNSIPFRERTVEWLLFVFACVSILSVIGITFFIFAEGLPLFGHISIGDFLFSSRWRPTDDNPSFGILAFIVGSILVTALSLIVAIPIGIFTGVFMAEYASPRWASIVRKGIELLAGIPSVIYGLFGFFFIVPIIRETTSSTTGLGITTAGLILGIMVLPTIISTTEVSLRAVPKDLKEGSLALGATNWQTIIHTLIPAARSGIIAGVVLGIGRSIGETMAVLMVAGNSPVMPTGPFSHTRTLTMNIVTDLKYAEVGSLHETSLFTTGIVLFIFIFIINILVQIIIKRPRKRIRDI